MIQISMLEPARNDKDLPKRIARELLAYIRRQNLGVGDRLPPQTVLAEQMHVSRTSLREALARLETEGLIRQMHGVGTFVANDPYAIYSSSDISLSMTEMIKKKGMTPGTSEITVSLEAAETIPAKISECLGIAGSAPLLCIARVRTADGTPFAYVIAYVVADLPGLSQAPEAYEGSLYEYLQEECNEFIGDVDATIEAYTPDENIRRKLGAPSGAPLLALHQCHRNEKGRAIVASVSYLIHNHLKLRVERRRSGHEYLQEE